MDTVNSCTSTPCQYGAECVDIPLGFDCRCRDGTAGDFCEINVNECENVVCQNNGVCVDGKYRIGVMPPILWPTTSSQLKHHGFIVFEVLIFILVNVF